MKAAVFHKPEDIRYTTVADPKSEPAKDIILRYEVFDEKQDDCAKAVLKP